MEWIVRVVPDIQTLFGRAHRIGYRSRRKHRAAFRDVERPTVHELDKDGIVQEILGLRRLFRSQLKGIQFRLGMVESGFTLGLRFRSPFLIKEGLRRLA